jgi:hypothetical protein
MKGNGSSNERARAKNSFDFRVLQGGATTTTAAAHKQHEYINEEKKYSFCKIDSFAFFPRFRFSVNKFKSRKTSQKFVHVMRNVFLVSQKLHKMRLNFPEWPKKHFNDDDDEKLYLKKLLKN